jgi:hypothetical protein
MQLKSLKHECPEDFEEDSCLNKKNLKVAKNESIMQTNDKVHALLFPILPFSLTAKKLKSQNCPKQILTFGDEFNTASKLIKNYFLLY